MYHLLLSLIQLSTEGGIEPRSPVGHLIYSQGQLPNSATSAKYPPRLSIRLTYYS